MGIPPLSVAVVRPVLPGMGPRPWYGGYYGYRGRPYGPGPYPYHRPPYGSAPYRPYKR